MKENNNKNGDLVRVNDRIRIPKVRLIKDEENLGVVDVGVAKAMAKEAGLDLVEVSPNARPPVCRIMDYGKFKYEQQKKKKKCQSSGVKTKEIKFGPAIGEGDLETKVNHAKEFLEDGMKVQLTLFFKKRQNAHRDLGFEVMKKFVDKLHSSGLCTIEQQPKLEGSNIRCKLEPVRNKNG